MVAAIGVLAWRAHVVPVAMPVPQPTDSAPAQSPPATAAEVSVHNQPSNEAAAVQPRTPMPAQNIIPHFDIARVEPDGSALVAGGAAPAAEVDLLDDGKVIAHHEDGGFTSHDPGEKVPMSSSGDARTSSASGR